MTMNGTKNKETESSKNARSALRKATRDADAAVSKYKETNSKELIGMDVKERREKNERDPYRI